jgi:formylglycine-generating enzyme required for sulfatase activity
MGGDMSISQQETPAPALDIGSTVISEKDDMTMIYIPGGTFFTGVVCYGSACFESDQTVDVNSFWIDKTEVTNEMYKRCVDDGICVPPYSYTDSNVYSYSKMDYFSDSDYENYPVVYVDTDMATTYCSWKDARLPTDLEWMKAARGTDGRQFPWGNTLTGLEANFCDITCTVESEKNYQDNLRDGYPELAPVGSFTLDSSPYGVLDMGGNVGELLSNPEVRNDSRGGSWATPPRVMALYVNAIHKIDFISDTVGFRCVMDAVNNE